MALFSRRPAPAPEPVEPDEPVNPPVTETPKTEYVSRDDFTRFLDRFETLHDNVSSFFARQNVPSHAAPVAPTVPSIDDVSDDEFEKAVNEGGPGAATVVRKRMKAEAARASQSLAQELNTIKSHGLSSIAHLTRSQLQAKPLYARYKKEVDQALDALDPVLQTNPQVLDSVYAMVIGQHAEEIAQEKVQEALRNVPVPTEEPTSKTRYVSKKGEKIPTPEDVWGKDGMDALESRYQSRSEAAVERFINSQGYATWEQYYEEVIKPYGH